MNIIFLFSFIKINNFMHIQHRISSVIFDNRESIYKLIKYITISNNAKIFMSFCIIKYCASSIILNLKQLNRTNLVSYLDYIFSYQNRRLILYFQKYVACDTNFKNIYFLSWNFGIDKYKFLRKIDFSR